ncbi:MAG: type II secretion system protein [Micavibrio sp.]
MRIKKTLPYNIQKNDGFTIIEMCLVIIVMGFMVLPLAQMYKNQLEQRKYESVRSKITDLASMASARKDAVGTYPCPSDRSLAPGDANFGLDIMEYGAVIPNCDGSMQGFCRANGARDTDIDADATIDPILIGGFPITSMQNALGQNELQGTISSQLGIDSWDNKYTYAVSEKLCQLGKAKNTNDFRWGVIEVVDEFDEPTAGIGFSDLDIPTDGNPDPDGQFVIISHGPSGRGAFSLEGAPVENCDTTLTEGENCDNDFTFTAALSNYKSDTNDFFDDIVYAHLYKPSDLWQVMTRPDGAGGQQATPDIMALNERYVGILTDTPQVKLDVAGDITATTIKSPRFCFNDGTKCFEYNWLGTTSSVTGGASRNTCGTAGQVINFVGNNSITCVTPSIQNPGVERRCDAIDPTKPYLRGIKTNGDLICTN